MACYIRHTSGSFTINGFCTRERNQRKSTTDVNIKSQKQIIDPQNTEYDEVNLHAHTHTHTYAQTLIIIIAQRKS